MLLSDIYIALMVYSLAQCIVNFVYAKRHSNSADWSYQNRVICRKTCKSHAYTAILMGVAALVLVILKK